MVLMPFANNSTTTITSNRRSKTKTNEQQQQEQQKSVRKEDEPQQEKPIIKLPPKATMVARCTKCGAPLNPFAIPLPSSSIYSHDCNLGTYSSLHSSRKSFRQSSRYGNNNNGNNKSTWVLCNICHNSYDYNYNIQSNVQRDDNNNDNDPNNDNDDNDSYNNNDKMDYIKRHPNCNTNNNGYYKYEYETNINWFDTIPEECIIDQGNSNKHDNDNDNNNNTTTNEYSLPLPSIFNNNNNLTISCQKFPPLYVIIIDGTSTNPNYYKVIQESLRSIFDTSSSSEKKNDFKNTRMVLFVMNPNNEIAVYDLSCDILHLKHVTMHNKYSIGNDSTGIDGDGGNINDIVNGGGGYDDDGGDVDGFGFYIKGGLDLSLSH